LSSRKALLPAVALFAVLACSPKAADAPVAAAADPAADEAKIRAEAPTWFDLYNKGDADGVTGLYTDDGVVLAPGVPAAVGKEAIRAYLAKDIAASRAAGITLNMGEVTGMGVSGDLAWLSGTFAAKDSAGNVVDPGKYTSVYKRVGTEWKLIRDTWNSDSAPAPAPPAKPAR
jgi:uncharacterized protein (TIGR02246 family)